jgi:hypothetical protein
MLTSRLAVTADGGRYYRANDTMISGFKLSQVRLTLSTVTVRRRRPSHSDHPSYGGRVAMVMQHPGRET